MEAEKPEDNEDLNFDFTEDIKILNERRQKRLGGESKTYTWEEAKAMLIRKSNFNNSK